MGLFQSRNRYPTSTTFPPNSQIVTPEEMKQLKTPRSGLARNVIIAIGALVCLLALLLPSSCDNTSLPGFLTLAVHQKLFASYLLGLLTMAVIVYH